MNRHTPKFFINKIISSCIVGLVLASCTTHSPPAPLTRINSFPSGATVSINGVGECETPCTIQHNVTRQVVVAKAGYLAQKFDVPVGAGNVTVSLELAAPTKSVEEQTLPEL